VETRERVLHVLDCEDEGGDFSALYLLNAGTAKAQLRGVKMVCGTGLELLDPTAAGNLCSDADCLSEFNTTSIFTVPLHSLFTLPPPPLGKTWSVRH
jgi:hypothetical protein